MLFTKLDSSEQERNFSINESLKFTRQQYTRKKTNFSTVPGYSFPHQ